MTKKNIDDQSLSISYHYFTNELDMIKAHIEHQGDLETDNYVRQRFNLLMKEEE